MFKTETRLIIYKHDLVEHIMYGKRVWIRVFPGLTPRDLKKLLKKMGVNIIELDEVKKVIIITKDKEISLQEPQVMVFDTGKQKIYQIIAEEIEEKSIESTEEKIEISEEDIRFVVEQTGVSYEKAKEALLKTKGDLAEAILLLNEEKKK